MNNNLKIIIPAIFLLAPVVFAEDLTAPSFILRDSAITVLGGRTDSASFQNISAAGQFVIGDGTSASYINQNGILYFSVASTTDGGGGGGGGPSSGAGPAPPPVGGIIGRIVKKIVGCNLAGDLNKDCRVNMYDVSVLLYGWGQSQKNPNFLASIKSITLPSPDINNDSKVDIKDLSVMLFNWTG